MKGREVIVSDEAFHDLEAARSFYDSRENGLGEYFIDSMIADLDSLIFFAGIHVKEYGYYKMHSKRFPYAMYYDLIGELVLVVAILDMRRNPTWLAEQIKSRKP